MSELSIGFLFLLGFSVWQFFRINALENKVEKLELAAKEEK